MTVQCPTCGWRDLMRPLLIFFSVVALTTACQAQSALYRLCYSTGGIQCQPVGRGEGTALPVGAGTASPAGSSPTAARQVRLCYQVAGVLPCQPVDASHPLPTQ